MFRMYLYRLVTFSDTSPFSFSYRLMVNTRLIVLRII
jgi:hypothetical protein